jgi:serine/threonine protein kinase
LTVEQADLDNVFNQNFRLFKKKYAKIIMLIIQRPWHELENNYQIMFKVGMGSIPSIPETMSSDGKDFVSHCLEPDPEIRWTASQLTELPFVKVIKSLICDNKHL